MKHENDHMNLSSSSSSSSDDDNDDDDYSSNNDEDIKDKFQQKDDNDYNFDDDGEDENDLDDIEWEDGSFEEQEEEQQQQQQEEEGIEKPNYNNIEETNNNSDDPMKSRRRKRKRNTNTTTASMKKQFKKIPLSNHDNNRNRRIKSLLQNIQKTHLLSLLSRCVFHSSRVTLNHHWNDHCHEKTYAKNNYDDQDELVLSVAYSLIPMEFIDYSMNEQHKQRHRKHYKNDNPDYASATTDNTTDNDDYPIVIPSKMVLDKFCSWFFQFVNSTHDNQATSTRSIEIDTDRLFKRRIHGQSRSLSSSNSTRSSNSSKRNKNKRQSNNRFKGDSRIQKMTQEKQNHNTDIEVTIQERLIKILEYLSVHSVCDFTINPLEKSLLIISMMR